MNIINTINIGGTTMKYLHFGIGEKPFVIIPGMSLLPVVDSSESIVNNLNVLAADYDIYLFDRKTDFDEGYSVEDMAEDTASVMEKLGISDACIYGTSQGAMIAQILAIDFPHLVKKLVLVSTLSRPNKRSKETFENWINVAKQGNISELNSVFLKNVYSSEFIEKNKSEFCELINRGTPEQVKKFIILAKACLDFNCYNKLQNITVPVLVLGSKRDKVTGVVGSYEIIEKLNCESYICSDYSHALIDEASDFLYNVKKFSDK